MRRTDKCKQKWKSKSKAFILISLSVTRLHTPRPLVNPYCHCRYCPTKERPYDFWGGTGAGKFENSCLKQEGRFMFDKLYIMHRLSTGKKYLPCLSVEQKTGSCTGKSPPPPLPPQKTNSPPLRAVWDSFFVRCRGGVTWKTTSVLMYFDSSSERHAGRF